MLMGISRFSLCTLAQICKVGLEFSGLIAASSRFIRNSQFALINPTHVMGTVTKSNYTHRKKMPHLSGICVLFVKKNAIWDSIDECEQTNKRDTIFICQSSVN